MKPSLKDILPIFITGLWINTSETIRWIFLVEAYWIDHYQLLGLTLPSEPINMIVWMVWGFLYAALIFILAKKFTMIQTMLLSWSAAFLLMWIVVWNVGVLPTDMLMVNVPLSLLEAYVAVLICKAFIKRQQRA